MAKTQKLLITLFIGVNYICDAAEAPSLVRKHSFSGSVGADGLIKVSAGPSDSTHGESSTQTQRIEIDADGVSRISVDNENVGQTSDGDSLISVDITDQPRAASIVRGKSRNPRTATKSADQASMRKVMKTEEDFKELVERDSHIAQEIADAAQEVIEESKAVISDVSAHVSEQEKMQGHVSASLRSEDLEDAAATYRNTRDATLKARDMLKLLMLPYKVARDAYVAATANYTQALQDSMTLTAIRVR